MSNQESKYHAFSISAWIFFMVFTFLFIITVASFGKENMGNNLIISTAGAILVFVGVAVLAHYVLKDYNPDDCDD